MGSRARDAVSGTRRFALLTLLDALLALLTLALLALSVVALATQKFNPFIYFLF